MDVRISDGPTDNVVGAVVFFSYIGLALFFSAFVGRDIVNLYVASSTQLKIKDKPKRRSSAQSRNAIVFLVLALVSFLSLSYHMLSFLIQSYTTWAQLNRVGLPESVLGSRGLLTLQKDRLSLHLWTWARRSTLFKDFAEVIVNDARRFWWTQQALIFSMGWNSFMVIEGVRCRIPHLWAYFVLDQILPISFTQNMFCVALTLSQNSSPSSAVRAAAPGDQFALITAFHLCLSIAPSTVERPSFFVVVFAIRALLTAPYWVLTPSTLATGRSVSTPVGDLYWRYRYTALVLIAGGIFLSAKQTQDALPLLNIIQALQESPPVAALGYDYIIGLFSLACFIFVYRPIT